jgi:hypothetical protein
MRKHRDEEMRVASYLESVADQLDIVLDLRALVRRTVPELCESIRFNALCYFKPDRPFGAIGGNACLINSRDDHVRLEFIHGAALPDPEGLLRGDGKAKRFIEIRTRRDVQRRGIRELLLAARAYKPGSDVADV